MRTSSWVGAALTWLGALNGNRTLRANAANVVASNLSVAGGGYVIEIANVGGKGVGDVQVELGGLVVGYRGGMGAGEVWPLAVTGVRDGAEPVVTSRHGSDRPHRERYFLWAIPSNGYRLSR